MFFVSSMILFSFGDYVIDEAGGRGARGKKTKQVNHDSIDFITYYDTIVQFIKNHEGFMPKSYYCAGGYLTIGYGHVILPNESYTTITEEQATNILKNDLNYSINYVKNLTCLTGKKLLIAGHFCYSYGIGYFSKSKMRFLMENNLNLDKEMLNHNFYINQFNHKVYSEYILNIRKFELRLWKK